VDYALTPRFGVRAQADFQQTHFTNRTIKSVSTTAMLASLLVLLPGFSLLKDCRAI